MITKILFLTLNIIQIKEAGEKEMIRYGARYTRILVKNIHIISTTNYGRKIVLLLYLEISSINKFFKYKNRNNSRSRGL